MRRFEHLNRMLQDKIESLPSVQHSPRLSVSSSGPLRSSISMHVPAQSVDSLLSAQLGALDVPSASLSLDCHSPSSADQTTRTVTCSQDKATVMIGHKKLTFDKNLIPDPPRRHFSQNLTALFKEWDDGELLSIEGHTIPLKYWPAIYQRRAP